MIPLGHQVNNIPLVIALGVAFALHFLFTLTYHVDFEWTAPKPGVLNITITEPATKTALVEPEVIEPALIKPIPADQETPKPDIPRAVVKAEPETPKTNYFAGEQWVIAKKVTTADNVQKIFIDVLPVTTQHALSLYSYVPADPIDTAAITCTNGVKNYVFTNCPHDSLRLASIEETDATMEPLLVMPTSRAPQYALSTPSNPRWYNEEERPNEDWTHLAGLPTISVPIY